MRKLLTRLCYFLIPLSLIMCIPFYVLWRSEENFYKIDRLNTSGNKYLVGYGYNEYNYRYLKWASLQQTPRKEVWALGASRVLEFRDTMFTTSFYNAGFTISGINDFLPFLKGLPASKYPRYLIIGLDHMMFNAACDSLKTTPAENFWKKSFRLYPRPAVYQAVFKDILSGKYPVVDFSGEGNISRIGLNVEYNNNGFRKDGSMYYGVQIPKLLQNDTTADDYNYANTLQRIKNGNMRFEYGSTVNDKALLELSRLLQFCLDNKIEPVAFFPPFSNKVYESMVSSGKYAYLQELFGKVKMVCDSFRVESYDFSKMALCNSDDRETIDGMHGSEVTYVKLLIKMLESGSKLNQVTDINRLRNDLQHRKNRYEVYNNL